MSDVMHEKAKEILELKRQELNHNLHAGGEAHEGRLKDIITALGLYFGIQRYMVADGNHQCKQTIQLQSMRN